MVVTEGLRKGRVGMGLGEEMVSQRSGVEIEGRGVPRDPKECRGPGEKKGICSAPAVPPVFAGYRLGLCAAVVTHGR